MSICTKCRQAGEKLYLKGAKCRSPKCTLEKRPSGPGQHGKRVGTKKLSEFGKQLQEKLCGLRVPQPRAYLHLHRTALYRAPATGLGAAAAHFLFGGDWGHSVFL
ncbi:hypothetical protein EBZ39_06535 [bacterium]|nr:hypothetical protein [bacterium]